MLYFNQETHTYTWEGEKVPSVNEILRAEGAIPPFFSPTADYKCQLGIYLHDAIRMHFASKLDEASLQGAVLEYFNGFRLFQSHFDLKPFAVEKSLYSEKWGFAGTPDCWTNNVLYDWKCSSSVYPYYALTLSAYSILIEEFQGYRVKDLLVVQLVPNNYKIINIQEDRQSFLAFLKTYQWKEKNLKGGENGQ